MACNWIMMALGTGTFGVHSLGHRTPFGAINQRGTWEMGNTDRLLADGCCRREYKSSSEEPLWGKGLTGGGGSRALESPSDVCVCVRSTAGIWG